MVKRPGTILHLLLIPVCIVIVLVWFVLGGNTTPASHSSSNIKPAAVQTKKQKVVFGIVANQQQVISFNHAFGSSPQMVMQFVSWDKGLAPQANLALIKQLGVKEYMLTWEPWTPTPAKGGIEEQSKLQKKYSNLAIAEGKWNSYIVSWAQAIKASGIPVYIRFGQEQNAGYYPWSRNPVAYVLAWRHIVTLFKQQGVKNASFVYSTAPQLSESNQVWARSFWRYWPGRQYVDEVGSTVINFGGGNTCQAIPCALKETTYPFSLFTTRLAMAHHMADKPLMITEFNTAQAGSTKWLNSLLVWLKMKKLDLIGLVLSQDASRSSAQRVTGNLNWNAILDPQTQPILKQILQAVS